MRMRQISVVKGERLELTPSEESIREGTTCSVDVKFYPENTNQPHDQGMEDVRLHDCDGKWRCGNRQTPW